MSSVFESLPEERQRKILDSALAEFAAHGYAGASTNRIVEKAEISKGILFHYFKTKKSLYLYVLRSCADFLAKQYEAIGTDLERDVFDRLQQVMVFKLQLMEQYPEEHELLEKAMTEKAEDIQSEFGMIMAESHSNGTSILFGDMDVSKFRPDVDIAKAIEVISWTLDNFGKKYIAENTSADGRILVDREKLLGGMNEYVDLLKKGLYK